VKLHGPTGNLKKVAFNGLRAKNDTDLDGTPQIQKAIEVDDLEKKGCAEERARALDGS